MRSFVLTATALGLTLVLAVALAWLSSRGRPPKTAPQPGPVVQRPPAAPPAPKLPTRFDDWLQDYEQAKQQAAREKKDVLVFLIASGRGAEAERMADALLDKEFWKPAAEKLVPVYIDLAGGGRSRAPVQNPGRNQRLWQRWLPPKLPAALIIEPEGERVIGAFGPLNVTPETYYKVAAEAIKGWEELGELFRRIELAAGREKLSAAQAALQHLTRAKLRPYYELELRAWVRLAEEADPGNRTGLPEEFFLSHWEVQLPRLAYQSSGDRPDGPGVAQLRRHAAQLTEWSGRHPFQDQDRAVVLYLWAARTLAWGGQIEEAFDMLRSAQALRPRDPWLAEDIQQGESLVLEFLQSGSGFFVSGEGHLLTNRHVIRDCGGVAVRVGGKVVQAEVVAEHRTKDIAILKAKLPKEWRPDPVPLAGGTPGRGERVFAFGYPVSDLLGSGVKLTQGSVAGVPEPGQEPRIIFDAKVNPGNSGGPLCDECGNVVGMVTAKTNLGPGMDNYGSAVCSDDLKSFLEKTVPGYAFPEARREKLEPRGVDGAVSPSVVLVLSTPPASGGRWGADRPVAPGGH
jgi:S1-C subfamily serine protease